MADNLSFLLEKSVWHLEKGLAMQRQGKLKEIGRSFLQVFRSLYFDETAIKHLLCCID